MNIFTTILISLIIQTSNDTTKVTKPTCCKVNKSQKACLGMNLLSDTLTKSNCKKETKKCCKKQK